MFRTRLFLFPGRHQAAFGIFAERRLRRDISLQLAARAVILAWYGAKRRGMGLSIEYSPLHLRVEHRLTISLHRHVRGFLTQRRRLVRRAESEA